MAKKQIAIRQRYTEADRSHAAYAQILRRTQTCRHTHIHTHTHTQNMTHT